MKEIRLTQDKIALVDDEDFEYLNQFNWRAIKDHNTWYAIRGKNAIRMHREILNICDKSILVDHIDRNGLNNTQENLRKCNHSENMRNRRLQSNNTSGFRGVKWEKLDKRWRAYIRLDGTIKHIGSFVDIIEAAKARDIAVIKYYGDYGQLNFPKETYFEGR